MVDNLTYACRIEDDLGRRLLNQFFFERVLIQGDRISGVVYTETARLILGYPTSPQDPTGAPTAPDDDADQDHKTNHGPQGDRGSNTDSLVGAAGVEPATARV